MNTAPLTASVRRMLPPGAARLAKRQLAPARFTFQCRRGRAGFRMHGARYAHRLLFIAGLPKSGSTWLKKMVAAFPGYEEALIPEIAAYELDTGGSHDFELPPDTFDRFRDALIVMKTHVHGSPQNVDLLRRARVPHAILFRDLRDVAVSYHFYVRRTPWHPEHGVYASLSTTEGLAVFGARLMPAYAAWVRSWHAHRDPDLSMIVRYEDLRRDTPVVLERVARHFGLGDASAVIRDIARAHSLKAMQAKDPAPDAFVRKGEIGDWRNHFTPELTAMYRAAIGDFLVEFGYERDHAW